MKLQILGTGCPKCQQLTENAKKALEAAGVEAEIEKVTDIKDIVKMGVMSTPALVIDGQVKAAGKVLSPAEIQALIA